MFATWTDAESKKQVLADLATAREAIRPAVHRAAAAPGAYRDVSSPNVSVRDGYGREDYDYFRPGEELPAGDKDVQAACMAAYRRFPLVRSVVDMMVDFVVKGIDVVHPSPRVQKFGKEWFRTVKGKKLARKVARHLFRAGSAPVRRFDRKLPAATLDQLRGLGLATGAAAIPVRYKVLNPVTVDAVGDDLNPFLDDEKTRYQVRVPRQLGDRLRARDRTDTPLSSWLPKEVADSLRGGTPIPLPPESTVVVHYQKDDHEVWPTPILYPLLGNLQMLVKLENADRAALDGAVSAIRVWKLGDHEAEILPTREAFEHLSGILLHNVGGGVMDLVWDSAIELIETKSDIANFLGVAKYVPTLAALFQGLGVPPSLAGLADGGGMTNNFVSLRVLVERLAACRDELVEFFEGELARLQRAFGFRQPFKLTFDVPSLSDDSVEKKLLIDLMDRDVVSAELVVERFGGDPDIEAARVRKDARQRKAGKAPPKAGPYHLDSQQAAHLERVFAQQGETTPSEHGLELRPRKAGERPAADKAAARKAREVAAKTAAQPAGRPLGARDGAKRKPKRVAPKQAVGETVLWALAAREAVADELRPAFLAARGKKALRALSDEDARVFDRAVFATLCALDPLAPVTPDAVRAAVAAAAPVPAEVDALYRHAVARHAGPLTADQDRRYQALAAALAV